VAIKGYRLQLDVDVSSMNYDDQINANVIVKTDLESRPEVTISVYGTVSGDLLLSPKVISFGYLSPNTTVNRVMLVRNENPDFTLEIGEIECASAEVEFVADAASGGLPKYKIAGAEVEFATKSTLAGKSYVITVTLKAGPNPAPVDANIVVHTNHPVQSTLTSKIRAMVGPPGGAKSGAPAPFRTQDDINSLIRQRSGSAR
jgi:hypothetical protein